ncbi:MAG: hypothetical protein RBS77_02005 [Candidatus Moranbacteria bacterium]|jgi:hypothetical protein|nr:hypothetical protein [Candidatus Moranbacteria bacterium]
MSKRPIGFSTGTFFKFLNPVSKEAIAFVQELGPDTVELNWHHIADRPEKNIGRKIDWSFKFVSIHLPVDMSDDNGIFATTGILSRAYRLFIQCYSFGYAVIHPDLITNWNNFNLLLNHNFSLPLAIENMDDRKKSFKDLPSLLEFFRKYPAIGLVFDVNHWVVNGNSISSISKTLQILISSGVRLAGIHLSGAGFHEPLFKTPHAEEIVRSLHVIPHTTPIIIESIFENRDEPAQELAFVRKHLEA